MRLGPERRPCETVDDYIVRVAVEEKMPVATADMELRRRLREAGVPVVYYRHGKGLEAEGWWD